MDTVQQKEMVKLLHYFDSLPNFNNKKQYEDLFIKYNKKKEAEVLHDISEEQFYSLLDSYKYELYKQKNLESCSK